MLLLSLKEAHAEANRAKAALAQCRSELADRKQVPRAACRLHPPTARVLGAPKASASPSSQASARQGPAAEGDADEVRRTPAGLLVVMFLFPRLDCLNGVLFRSATCELFAGKRRHLCGRGRTRLRGARCC